MFGITTKMETRLLISISIICTTDCRRTDITGGKGSIETRDSLYLRFGKSK